MRRRWMSLLNCRHILLLLLFDIASLTKKSTALNTIVDVGVVSML